MRKCWGMAIGLDLDAHLLGTAGAAPVLPKGDKELLHRRVSILFLREIDALALRISEKCFPSQAQSTVIRGVFAQFSLPLIFRSSTAVKPLYSLPSQSVMATNFCAIIGRPPVGHVAVAVELAALIVEAVREFVAHDGADMAVISASVPLGS